jgi:hypothetical protein
MEEANSFVKLAHIHVRDKNYDVSISLNTISRTIHVFKYNEEKVLCEYEVFDNTEDCCDYLELLL